jgi:hypothetical protein
MSSNPMPDANDAAEATALTSTAFDVAQTKPEVDAPDGVEQSYRLPGPASRSVASAPDTSTTLSAHTMMLEGGI